MFGDDDSREVTGSRVFRSSFPDREPSGFRTAVWDGGVPAYGDDIELVHQTLLHGFAHAAKANATTGITLLHDDAALAPRFASWRAIYHQASAMAVALTELGLQAGDRVLLVLPTSIEFVTTFFAVQLAGAIPVPSYPPAALERTVAALARLGTISATAGASLCVTVKRLRPLLGQLAASPGMRAVIAVEDLSATPTRKLTRPRVGGDQTAFLQFTSGSTGNPKGVVISHHNACHNIQAIGQAARVGRGDVVVSWLPLYHDMGLVGTLLFSVYFRLPLVLMSPLAFLARPSRWLRAIHDHRATLSPAPNFAYAMCAKRVPADERHGLDLSSWRIALNGAEPVNMRTIDAFLAAYEPHGFQRTALMPVYGLAEVTLAASFPRPGDPVRGEVVDRAALARGHAVSRPQAGDGTMTVVSVGRPVPGHQIRVVDEHGEPLPEREVGHIVISGPSVMRGYFGDTAATAAVLRGDSLWTGDLGYQAGGDLFVTGRASDVIIVHGRNYYAEDLEAVAGRVDGVRPGGLVAFSVYDDDEARDLVIIVCESKVADEQGRIALARSIGDEVVWQCGVKVDEVVLAERGTIPKTPSGKPQRHLTRELYLSDRLVPNLTGKLGLAVIAARSGAGFLMASARRMFGRRRDSK